jgi:aminopeptidase N
MEDLRVRMGDDDFFRFLKDYASRYSHGHATSYDFFYVVRQNTTADTGVSDDGARWFVLIESNDSSR